MAGWVNKTPLAIPRLAREDYLMWQPCRQGRVKRSSRFIGKHIIQGMMMGVKLFRLSSCEPPLDIMFGADAVERWFTEQEALELVAFANKMAV
ncbi:MAG TPA: hypothetical protein PKC99_19125 [Anaerolineales bacterium]|jgi:hypothetical protein|nr:hypothetical protein [Anaerolineales bacterium]MDL1926012.1 hypothetical protein [Anaerolineae bacterium AMX1]NOG75085.1 hypothetical protein [Chloroflexota bacterium]MDX9937982.1 hypothetical protein [Anaerolineales bacterium]WKZ52355.1 MAG: hypothetical protein QY329_06385 [Anaerolineales bacterium]